MGAAAVAAALLAGGAGGGQDPGGYWMRTDARFAPAAAASAASKAVTYDRKLVPAAAWIEVGQRTAPDGATTVDLRVTGARAHHHYGVHVHRKPCGADPAAAGGHYQHKASAHPEHVNSDNEVWLDFTADAHGEGRAKARHDWGFRRGEASSVVIHDQPGGAGKRAACFTVPFGWVTGTG